MKLIHPHLRRALAACAVFALTCFASPAWAETLSSPVTLTPNNNATAENGTLNDGFATLTWNTESLSSSLTNYAFTFTLTYVGCDDGRSISVVIPTGSAGTKNLNVNYAMGITSSDNDILLLKSGTTKYKQTAIDVTELRGSGESRTYTLAVLDNMAYLWEGDSISENFAESMADKAMDLTDISSALTSGTSLVKATANCVSVTPLSVTNLGNDAIPEPTTAMLSLLALVGLAARRRRK